MAYIEGATWINNGTEEKIVAGNDLEDCYADGWKKGMLASIQPEPKPEPIPTPKKDSGPKKKQAASTLKQTGKSSKPTKE